MNSFDLKNLDRDTIPEFIDEGYNLSSIDEITEPNNANEALRSPVWKKSMDEEYAALLNKKTWELVIPPEMLIL